MARRLLAYNRKPESPQNWHCFVKCVSNGKSIVNSRILPLKECKSPLLGIPVHKLISVNWKFYTKYIRIYIFTGVKLLLPYSFIWFSFSFRFRWSFCFFRSLLNTIYITISILLNFSLMKIRVYIKNIKFIRRINWLTSPKQVSYS